MSIATVKPSSPIISVKRALNKYAPYWANDTVMNPVLVRFVSVDGEWIEVQFPDGHIEQVHAHTLGVFRAS